MKYKKRALVCQLNIELVMREARGAGCLIAGKIFQAALQAFMRAAQLAAGGQNIASFTGAKHCCVVTVDQCLLKSLHCFW